MAITFNGPQNIYGPQRPKTERTPQKEQSPREKRKLREKQRLEKEQEKLKERLKRLEKYAISNILKNIALKTAQMETDKKPMDLFQEILPVLKDMGIHNITEKNKTEIVETKKVGVRKQKDLYKIVIRRKEVIESDLIKRINRENKNFEKLEWSSNGIEIFVWGNEYEIEEKEKKLPIRAPRPVPSAIGF